MNLIKTQPALFTSIFDEFFKNPWDINVSNYSFKSPSFNLKESDTEFILELAIPGKINDNFKLELDSKVLKVSLLEDKKDNDYNYNIKEFEYSSFEKSFEIPDYIDQNKISSFYRNGILSINLPKRKEFQNITKKIIEVKN